MATTKLKDRLDNKLQSRESVTEKERVLTMPDTSLAPVESGYVALTSNALDIISENLKKPTAIPLTL